MYNRKHIEIGHAFGEWVVLESISRLGGDQRYLCQCACGVERVLSAGMLASGKVLHCGCVKTAVPTSVAIKKRAQTGQSVEDFDLINKGYLPRADQLSHEGGSPAWTLTTFAEVLGLSRDDLILYIKGSGKRFEDRGSMS
jgi:hypothetical protein